MKRGLFKVNMGGSGEVLRVIIGDGTARMPGFKYTPQEQIAASAGCIKTLVPGNQDVPTAPPAHAEVQRGCSNGFVVQF